MVTTKNPAGTRCLTHPDEEMSSRCKACQKPMCAKCTMRKPEGVFCSEACWNKNKQHNSRLNEMRAKDAKFQEAEDARIRKARVVYFLIGVVFLVAGVYFVQHSNMPLFVSIKAVIGPFLKKLGL